MEFSLGSLCLRGELGSAPRVESRAFRSMFRRLVEPRGSPLSLFCSRYSRFWSSRTSTFSTSSESFFTNACCLRFQDVNKPETIFASGDVIRFALRLGVAGALLVLVFRLALPEDETDVVAAITGAWQTGFVEACGWFALSFLLLGVSLAIGTSRFAMLLSSAGLEVGWSVLFRAYIVAGFFNLVLPGAMLGDVYRLWDVRREAGEGSRALGIIAVDRLLGLSALACLGLIAAPFIPFAADDRSLAPVLMAICGAITISPAVVLHPKANHWMRSIGTSVSRFSKRAGSAIDGSLHAAAEVAEVPRVLWRSFFLGLLEQGLSVVSVYCLAVPLAGEPAWYWFAIIVPFVTVVSLIPISIGGTGVREALYVILFGAVGMPREAALALSLSFLATAIIWAVIGFVVFSIDRRQNAAPVESSSS